MFRNEACRKPIIQNEKKKKKTHKFYIVMNRFVYYTQFFKKLMEMITQFEINFSETSRNTIEFDLGNNSV